MNNQQQLPPDTRPLLAESIRLFVSLSDNTRDDQLALATPCDDYDVLMLLAHTRDALGRIRALANHEKVEGRIPPGSADPATIRQEITAAATAAIDAWQDDSLLGEILHPPFGAAPGAIVAISYCSEMLTHSWDLATATGQHPTWPEEDQIEFILAGMQRALPANRDDYTPFDEPTEVTADAPAIERLAAWTGRTVS